MSTNVSGAGTIESWDEQTYLQIDDGRKLTKATVRMRYSGAWDGESTSESLMCHAAADAVSYVGLEHFAGRIGERSGSFVIQSTGVYDGTEARSEGEVVAGSGTGDFAGIRGRHTSVSTHADYPSKPFAFEYDID